MRGQVNMKKGVKKHNRNLNVVLFIILIVLILIILFLYLINNPKLSKNFKEGELKNLGVLNSQAEYSILSQDLWIPRGEKKSWTSVAMSADGSRQTAVVIGGQIYVSTDYGYTWAAKESNRSWTSVAMSENGSRHAAFSQIYGTYVSTDYGNTWTAKESNR